MAWIKNIFKNLFGEYSKKSEWLPFYNRQKKTLKFSKKSIYEYLVDSVGEDRDFIALNYFGNRITYYEFLDDIDICAHALRSYGVKEKDIVTICLPNMPEALVAFYACNKIGAIADMVHPLSSPNQLELYLKENKSRILFLVDFDYDNFKDVIAKSMVYKTILVSPKQSMPTALTIGYTITRDFKRIRPSRRDTDYLTWKDFMFKGLGYTKDYKAVVDKDDVAVILHSGGTTGSPKGIMISKEKKAQDMFKIDLLKALQENK